MGCVNNNANLNLNQQRVVIKPVMASLSRDTEAVGKMDPYCKIFLGGQSRQTPVCTDGGKQPRWNTSFTFITSDRTLKIQVWDKDNVSDDLIGRGLYNLANLNYMLPSQDDLTFKNRSAGRVQVNISTGQQPMNGMGPTNMVAPQYGMQQPMMGGMGVMPNQGMGMMPNQGLGVMANPSMMQPNMMQPNMMQPNVGLVPNQMGMNNGWNQI